MVEDDFFELLVNFFLLAQDDIPFALYGLGVKFGVLKNVGEDIDGFGDIVVERFGVVDCVLALGKMLVC